MKEAARIAGLGARTFNGERAEAKLSCSREKSPQRPGGPRLHPMEAEFKQISGRDVYSKSRRVPRPKRWTEPDHARMSWWFGGGFWAEYCLLWGTG